MFNRSLLRLIKIKSCRFFNFYTYKECLVLGLLDSGQDGRSRGGFGQVLDKA